MKKKVFKIIMVIVAIVLVVFLIDLARKTYIISKCNKANKEYEKIDNFYMKMLDEDVTVETWKKEDLGIYKRTDKTGMKMVYFGEDSEWIIVDIVDSNKEIRKQAIKFQNSKNLIMPILDINTFYTENFWQTIKMAFITRITTEEINGIECYKIYIAEDYQIFVNKDNFLRMREINGSTDTGNIEYKLNEVTDEEVKLPNLEGFEIQIKENN